MTETTPARALAAVRDRAQLVHCITAAVSMNIVADVLLAAGARPMMTETAQKAPAVVTRAQALLVNLDTLSTDGVHGIPPTVAAAHVRRARSTSLSSDAGTCQASSSRSC